MADEDNVDCRHILRDNPKKSRKFDDEFNSEEMASQSDREVATISMRVRKKSKHDSSHKYGKEEENAAMCLLMLSTGTHSVHDLCKKIPSLIGFFGNKVESFCCGDEDQQHEKPKISSLSDFRYQCTICNKRFQSYQALGGHRTSHRKMKGGDYKELINQSCETVGKLPVKLRCHKCSICGKNFPSGQALGGHKRSHLVAANKSSNAGRNGVNGVHPHAMQMEIEQKVYKLNSIDLNLPALDNECWGI